MRRVALFLTACAAVSAISLYAQQADLIGSTNNTAGVLQSVPRLIMFSGMVKDLTGKPLTGPLDLNFAIYKEQTDAAPLWQESQTLNVDEQGHYTALLGAMQAEGLPVDLFTSGEARWLGLSVGKLPEQPRVLLVSVPYALKAGDAATLGGKPASAYALAPAAEGSTPTGAPSAGSKGLGGAAASELATPGTPKSGAKPNVAGTGTKNYLPLWTDSVGTLGNSVIYQSSGLVGIGTTTPAAKLDVAGSVGHFLVDTSGAQFRFTRGGANYFLASTAGGYFDFVVNGLTPSDATASLKLAANGVVNFMAGNVGIGTLTPAHKLDVVGDIYASTRVTGTQLFSTVPTGTAPLSVASSTLVPNLNADLLGGLHASAFAILGANTFTGSQAISSGDLSLPQTTSASTGVINLGGSPFIHACCSLGAANTFVGSNAGNFTTTGDGNTALGSQALYNNTLATGNTAIGAQALASNTQGGANTATGYNALWNNTTGYWNTASGYAALFSNTTGYWNTATGSQALTSNTTGYYNTASGDNALWNNTTGYYNTAIGNGALYNNISGGYNTAIGAEALQFNCGGAPTGCIANLNSALGYFAGTSTFIANANVTGANDTFLGAFSGPGTASINPVHNATAIGANAVVAESNALVLGSINGVNGATASVNVGIGTATPGHVLDVVGDIHASSNITTGGVFTGNGSGLTNVTAGTATTAAGLSCTGCVGNTQLGVNYAASASQGGAASNALLLNGLASSAFQPAGSYAVTTGPNTFTADQTLNAALNLPQTTGADVGVINLGGNPLIHVCCAKSTDNTFVGTSAGTFTADATGTNSGVGGNTGVGYQALDQLTSGFGNTANGAGALRVNNSGSYNTAVGAQALFGNTSGAWNTALGVSALYDNSTGGSNTALGVSALYLNSTGSDNTATGYSALGYNDTGQRNVADGKWALWKNTVGGSNVAVGTAAGSSLTTGGSNIMIGDDAGDLFTSIENNNIAIGNFGSTGDVGVIRIGSSAHHNSTYIAGIRGATTGMNNAVAVLIDSNGQLGTVSSSRRYKEDIRDMGGASDGLLRLRPVTFRYKKPYDDGSKPIQYGLIAEEVNEVYPDLVVFSKDGQPETVQYYKLDAMLLNEVQKLAKEHAADQKQIAELKQAHDSDRVEIAAIKSQVAEERKERQGQQAELSRVLAQVRVIQVRLAGKSTTRPRVRAANNGATPPKPARGMTLAKVQF